jgi:hypothetical protein
LLGVVCCGERGRKGWLLYFRGIEINDWLIR